MGIVFRQSVKSSIAIFSGALLGALTMYFSTHFMIKQEMGFRQNLINQAAVAGQILLVGLHNMIGLYIHRYPDGDKRKSALMTMSAILPLLIIGLVTVGYYIFKENIFLAFQPEDLPFIKRYFVWLPLFTLLTAYHLWLEVYLVSQLKVAKAIFIREVLLRALNIILIFLFGYDLISYNMLIYCTVLIYVVPITMLVVIAKNTNAFSFSFKWNVFERAEKKEIIHYTWYHSLLNISGLLMGTLDALMLAGLSENGMESVAIYSVALFIISFLQTPYKGMLSSIYTILNKAYTDGDMEKVKDIFMRSSINIFIASSAMFLLVSCNLHNAVALLPTGFEAMTEVVLILSLGRMVDMATGVNDYLLSVSRYYKYNFHISILLVILIIAFNYWLIPIYDIYGAAWGTSIAFTIYNAIKMYIVYRKLSIQPFTGKTLLVLLATLTSFIAGYLLPRLSNPFVDTLYRSGIILGIYISMLLLLKPSEDLNTYIASIKKDKRFF